MARTKEEQRAYAKGYNAGIKGKWPEHKPPVPPHALIAELLIALRGLRDVADDISATLSPDDDFVVAFNPLIDAADVALVKVADWLTEESPP